MPIQKPNFTKQTMMVALIIMKGQPVPARTIKEKTKFESGLIYPILARLEEFGLAKHEQDRQHPNRRLYSLTDAGINRVNQEAEEWSAARRITSGELSEISNQQF